MFVMNVKLSKKKMAAGVMVIAIIILVLVGALSGEKKDTSKNGENDIARAEFLKGYGWMISSEPVESSEVQIPVVFDNVYEQYNAIQKEQEYDLEPYKGLLVTRYTYNVTNFPGREDVLANLLIYNDRVIGGDICTTELDGFMVGFGTSPGEAEAGAAGKAAAETNTDESHVGADTYLSSTK